MKQKFSITSKHLLLIFSIVIVSVTLSYCSNDDTALTTTTYLYTFSAIVPIILIFLFALKKGGIFSNTFNIFFISLTLMFAILYTLISYIYRNLNDTSLLLLSYISFILSISIIICGLAIFHKIFVNNIMRMDGTPKFVLSLIFFIPCLLNDFISSLKNEFITAPTVAYFLIALELILIVSFYAVKKLLEQNIISKEIVVLQGKVFLDTKGSKVVANILDLRKDTIDDNALLLDQLHEKKPLSYSLSLWIQVIQPEMNDTEYPILLYGDNDNPKPQITFKQDKETGTNVLNIDLSGKTGERKTTNTNIIIEYQKWNNLVFNYDGFTADIFLNGLLYRTINMSKNVPVHSLSDTITIGSKSLTLNGAVADIRYSTSPLSAYQILAKYRIGVNTINL